MPCKPDDLSSISRIQGGMRELTLYIFLDLHTCIWRAHRCVCVWIAGMLSKSKTSNKPWSLSHNFKISSPEKCLFCTFARWLFCSSKLILYFHCKEFSAPTLFCPLYLYVLQELVQKVWDYLFKVVYHPTLAFSCNLKLLHLLLCLLFFPTNEK